MFITFIKEIRFFYDRALFQTQGRTGVTRSAGAYFVACDGDKSENSSVQRHKKEKNTKKIGRKYTFWVKMSTFVS